MEFYDDEDNCWEETEEEERDRQKEEKRELLAAINEWIKEGMYKCNCVN